VHVHPALLAAHYGSWKRRRGARGCLPALRPSEEKKYGAPFFAKPFVALGRHKGGQGKGAKGRGEGRKRKRERMVVLGFCCVLVFFDVCKLTEEREEKRPIPRKPLIY
jgi:hypothetical protein